MWVGPRQSGALGVPSRRRAHRGEALSKHRSNCKCTTRSDGSVSRCQLHRLEHDLSELLRVYESVCAQIGDRGSIGIHLVPGSSVNLNVSAIDFTAGFYEDTLGELMPGVAYSVLGYRPLASDPEWAGMEANVRAVFGEARPMRSYPPGWDGTGAHPFVVAALHWLGRQAQRLLDADEVAADRVRETCHRLLSRGRTMVDGPVLKPGWNVCPGCHYVHGERMPFGSLLVEPARTVVVRDGDGTARVMAEPARGWCANADCGGDGHPSCWALDPEFVDGDWIRVPPPETDWQGRPIMRPSLRELEWAAVAAQAELAQAPRFGMGA